MKPTQESVIAVEESPVITRKPEQVAADDMIKRQIDQSTHEQLKDRQKSVDRQIASLKDLTDERSQQQMVALGREAQLTRNGLTLRKPPAPRLDTLKAKLSKKHSNQASTRQGPTHCGQFKAGDSGDRGADYVC